MTTQTYQVTPEGLEQLKTELTKLKSTDRPETVKRMAEARELGDLSENADYSDAREQLAFIEGRIEELETMIKHAEVVTAKGDGSIQIGNTVTVQMAGQGETTYTIVGSSESDPTSGKISAESPVGSALVGRKVGDSVSVKTPNGKLELSIKKVS